MLITNVLFYSLLNFTAEFYIVLSKLEHFVLSFENVSVYEIVVYELIRSSIMYRSNWASNGFWARGAKTYRVAVILTGRYPWKGGLTEFVSSRQSSLFGAQLKIWLHRWDRAENAVRSAGLIAATIGRLKSVDETMRNVVSQLKFRGMNIYYDEYQW